MTKTLLFASLFMTVFNVCGQTPPAQPATGPGGRDYVHGKVSRSGPFGKGALAYYLFEPAQPKPRLAPVVVFLHGYQAVSPDAYLGWIGHLVRRGNTVVFPVYQNSAGDAVSYTGNAISTIQSALERLRTQSGRVRPEAGKFALVGHSLGATLAANVAGLAADRGLPTPGAVFLANAGDANSLLPGIPSVLLPPENIPNLLMIGVVGEEDVVTGDGPTVWVLDGASGVPPENRNLIRLRTDDYGTPDLLADHGAPLSTTAGGRRSNGADAFDFLGYWKWLDALLDAAFRGENRNVALGDSEEQRFLGQWSDGTPVTEPLVETY